MIRETRTKMNLARRLPRISCTTRSGGLIKTELGAYRRPPRVLTRWGGGVGLATRMNTGCGLFLAFLEPDLLHRHRPITQEANFHSLHIRLIEALKHMIVLR